MDVFQLKLELFIYFDAFNLCNIYEFISIIIIYVFILFDGFSEFNGYELK